MATIQHNTIRNAVRRVNFVIADLARYPEMREQVRALREVRRLLEDLDAEVIDHEQFRHQYEQYAVGLPDDFDTEDVYTGYGM